MISVVVPLYNYAHFIEDNITSIIAQSYSDWELIIVDDASTDNPLAVIDQYLSDKISYVRLDDNRGYGHAKNVGIRHSKGEYIVVLDADDMLTRKSLEMRLNFMAKRPKLKWVHAKAYEFSGSKPPYKFRIVERKANRRLKVILKTNNYRELWTNIHAQTVMIHRGVYEKLGLYEESIRSMGDKEMWARIINNIGIPGYLKKFTTYYRCHSGQMHRSSYKKKNVKKLTKKLARFIRARKRENMKGVPTL